MSITIGQILDAVELTLSAAPTLARSMSYDELTEGINDTPLLQVYAESGTQDTTNSVDRTTFLAGVRQTELIVHCDYYAQQRKHIGEDMAALVDGIDAMFNIFEAQRSSPFFGLQGIQAFHFSFSRVTFDYGAQNIRYVGARFTLTLRIF